ncbi:Kinesin-like protein NACK1 [Apostasia shenzhenica]|uniref:Kinesin-like protein n=1 Tax=Apostasia shenzhenica TaxID=1088818 RepID=A0A2H9ZT91_9ASPA|nr:Kinesin-like protein NACK1 [Apostasia shenzhenica]
MGAVGGEELQEWDAEAPAAVVAGGAGGGKLERILVSVRLRPLSEKEIAASDPAEWECINDSTIIFRSSLPDRPMAPTAYSFDRVFGSECTTQQVYEEAAKEVALSVVSGINSSIFAYGQTSSGKTYTMSGITEYAIVDVYDYIKRHPERAFSLKFSAVEIYNEAVRDLLSMDSTPLRLLDDPERGTIIEKLTEETLRDWNHFKALLALCEAQRRIGETSLNEMSSRSHQILRLTIESSAREFLGQDNTTTLAASVSFVDLAGSERASQALSVGARLKEGCHINRSLLTLGTVIRKLRFLKGRNGHIPYRESKLTRILQSSLGGNARTAIICTICPARSHIEQSRNTLLFASCAKEVTNSAQVNVVMSDKALVKHLQKELARLESELRYPGSASSISRLEILLREKDSQIRKMEREIKELIQQRDLAQSRLEDLLKVVGDVHTSRQFKEETNHASIFQPSKECQNENSMSATPKASSHALNSGFNKLRRYESKNRSRNYPGFSEEPENDEFHSEVESGEEASEDSYELCKEVRCIEMDTPGQTEKPSFSFPEQSRNQLTPISCELSPAAHMDSISGSKAPSFLTLEHHLHSVRRLQPDESSLWSSAWDVHSSNAALLRKSKSCRATMMMSRFSPGFVESEMNDCTPPSSSLRTFPGRPVGLERAKPGTLNSGSEDKNFSRHESIMSDCSNSALSASKEGIASIQDFVNGMKEMVEVHHNEFVVDKVRMITFTILLFVEGTTRSVGLDPIFDSMNSPSRWPQQFEKQQQDIIKLWHDCNVSLLHRTYFFLLIKGDPADSIYMEVELRRLSFLKRSLAEADQHSTPASRSETYMVINSSRILQREREMLSRQIKKRLSVEERLSLYSKWGISLHSKQRKLQLARVLWTNAGDLEHVRESASTVAKLVGLQESGQVLKEMFGLSFSPQKSYRRSYRWRHGIHSLK